MKIYQREQWALHFPPWFPRTATVQYSMHVRAFPMLHIHNSYKCVSCFCWEIPLCQTTGENNNLLTWRHSNGSIQNYRDNILYILLMFQARWHLVRMDKRITWQHGNASRYSSNMTIYSCSIQHDIMAARASGHKMTWGYWPWHLTHSRQPKMMAAWVFCLQACDLSSRIEFYGDYNKKVTG